MFRSRLFVARAARAMARRRSPLPAVAGVHVLAPTARHREWSSTNASAALGVLGAAAAAAGAVHIKQGSVDNSSSPSHNDQSSPRTKSGALCLCESLHRGPNDDSQQPLGQESGVGQAPFRVKQAYELLKVIGEGTYGMVYQARRKADGLVVALKTMPREQTGQTEFEREVAALQALSQQPPPSPTNSSDRDCGVDTTSTSDGGEHHHHPDEAGRDHVVQLYDLHRDDKNYYLAMELIEGGELFDHLLENGPYSEAVAASFLRQFAEAICFVHHAGLTHADLKPENLMMSCTDATKAKLKVVDFGCACNHDWTRKEMQLPAQEFAMGCSFLHHVALGNSNRSELERMLRDKPDLVNFRDYDRRTPLHIAASEGHVDLCQWLAEKGARINRSDRWGGYPLDDAHRHGHSDVVRFLRSRGARFGSTSRVCNLITAASVGDANEVRALLEFGTIDLNQGDYDRRTALHLAAGEGRLEIVKLLCEAGADVNVEDRWGSRPLDDAKGAKKAFVPIMRLLERYGAKSGGIATSAVQKEAATMHDLMDHSLQDGTPERNDGHQDEGMTRLAPKEFALGCSVLHQAALGNQFELEKILQERPDLVNFRDYDRRTALHIAASEGHVDICRYLVRKGARINRSDRWGGSPLDDAHRHRHSDVVQFLRQCGARFGSTSQETNFITAASEGDKEEVKAFLEFGTIDMNEGDYDRRTALHLAAGEGRLEIVKLLCEAGADVNVEDRWGSRPLDDAKGAKKNSVEIIRLLQEYGAKSATISPAEQQLTIHDPKDCTTEQDEEESFVPPPTGTVAYCPPELFSKDAVVTPKADMWATGVIMFIFLTGSHPFDKFSDKTDEEIEEVVIKVANDEENRLMDELVFDERVDGLSDSCVDLMRDLLQPDPDRRMSSEDFRRHPWIQGLTVSWKKIEQDDKSATHLQHRFKSHILSNFAGAETDASTDSNRLREIFNAIDLEGNGVLDPHEIRVVLRSAGEPEDVISSIVASLDLNHDGGVSWNEFQKIMGTTDD